MKLKSFSLLPLLPLSAAILPGTRTSNLFPGTVSDSVWLSSFRTPNTTTSVSLPGYNLTSTYPGTPSLNWKYTLSIVADIPRFDRRDYLTGSWIRLEPPEDLLRDIGNGSKTVEMHESWNLCQVWWVSEKVSASEEVDGDTCEGGLERECYEALKRSLGRRVNGGCPSVRVPEECDKDWGVGEGGWGSEGVAIGAGWNLSQVIAINGSFSFHQDTIGRGLEFHEAGNTTAYEEMVKRVYIIGHTWGPSDNFTAPPHGIAGPGPELKCLRAKQLQESGGEGSKDGGEAERPEDKSEASATRAGCGTWISLLAALTTVLLL